MILVSNIDIDVCRLSVLCLSTRQTSELPPLAQLYGVLSLKRGSRKMSRPDGYRIVHLCYSGSCHRHRNLLTSYFKSLMPKMEHYVVLPVYHTNNCLQPATGPWLFVEKGDRTPSTPSCYVHCKYYDML